MERAFVTMIPFKPPPSIAMATFLRKGFMSVFASLGTILKILYLCCNAYAR
jgi:hypothetical protein